MKRKIKVLVQILGFLSFVFVGCDEGVTIKDGYVIKGEIVDLENGKYVSNVKIFLGDTLDKNKKFLITN